MSGTPSRCGGGGGYSHASPSMLLATAAARRLCSSRPAAAARRVPVDCCHLQGRAALVCMSATGRGREESAAAAAAADEGHLPFGPHAIPASHVFLATTHSFAFVNLKPVVPGHVLVSPRRVVPRLAGLRADEVADLFAAATRVSATVERHFGAGSVTLAVQDGPLAGQTVPHVHVHVLPRTAGDFERNDDIYTELERGDDVAGAVPPPPPPPPPQQPLNPDAPRAARSAEDMAAEAAVLRALF